MAWARLSLAGTSGRCLSSAYIPPAFPSRVAASQVHILSPHPLPGSRSGPRVWHPVGVAKRDRGPDYPALDRVVPRYSSLGESRECVHVSAGGRRHSHGPQSGETGGLSLMAHVNVTYVLTDISVPHRPIPRFLLHRRRYRSLPRVFFTTTFSLSCRSPARGPHSLTEDIRSH